MHDEKTQLLQQLDDARDYLWSLLDGLAPDSRINPGWNKRDFFAHIAGWEAMVYEVFRDYVAGVPVKSYTYTGVDDANRVFVENRQSLSLEDARLECEINRFAIKTLLQRIEDYHQPIPFPWGSETVASFIQGAINHEREHAEEIVRQGNFASRP
jgi:hypothetical protein